MVWHKIKNVADNKGQEESRVDIGKFDINNFLTRFEKDLDRAEKLVPKFKK